MLIKKHGAIYFYKGNNMCKYNIVGAGPCACPNKKHDINMKIKLNILGNHIGLPLH